MRLAPIENPPTLFLRAAYWVSRRRLGAVMSPLKVVYARLPELLWANRGVLSFLERDEIPGHLRHSVTTWVSTLNGCSFCADLHQAEALRDGADFEAIRELANYAESPLFSERERVALAYAEQVTLEKKASEETFAALRANFTEREIVYLTWLTAVTNYLNLMAVPLGLESDGFLELARTERAQKVLGNG